MGGMAKLLENGRLAVVQGVGYPNPDRSHFRSMEIWETAGWSNDAKALETGWLGRALDSKGREAGRRSAGSARRRPLACRWRCESTKTEVPSVESLESYKLQLAGTEPEKQAERYRPQRARAASIGASDDPCWASSAGPRCRPTSRAAGWSSSPPRRRAVPSTPISAWPDASS